MSDVSAIPSFYEHLKMADRSRAQQRFIETLNAKAGILVTIDDIMTAVSFSRDELFMIAVLTIACQRKEREVPNAERCEGK
jgi:hypothetical protein